MIADFSFPEIQFSSAPAGMSGGFHPPENWHAEIRPDTPRFLPLPRSRRTAAHAGQGLAKLRIKIAIGVATPPDAYPTFTATPSRNPHLIDFITKSRKVTW
jgi:hypothetical protein